MNSGATSTTYSLSEGNTTDFQVTVTDTHNSALIRTYHLAVHRQASADDTLSGITIGSSSASVGSLSPSFSASHTSYTIAVGNTDTSLTLTPIMAGYVCCAIQEGIKFDNGDGVWIQHTYWGTNNQPAATDAIPLIEGGTTTVRFQVTAQDLTSVLYYTVAITRAASTDADLKSLVLNANGAAVTFYPSFSASTLAYNANIVQGETTATVAVSAYRHPNPTPTCTPNPNPDRNTIQQRCKFLGFWITSSWDCLCWQ